MSVLSVASGHGAERLSLKEPVLQRPQNSPSSVSAAENTATPGTESVPKPHPVVTGYAARFPNLFGAAAYAAVMNPQSSTSIQVDA